MSPSWPAAPPPPGWDRTFPASQQPCLSPHHETLHAAALPVSCSDPACGLRATHSLHGSIRLNELPSVKCPAQFLAPSRDSINAVTFIVPFAHHNARHMAGQETLSSGGVNGYGTAEHSQGQQCESLKPTCRLCHLGWTCRTFPIHPLLMCPDFRTTPPPHPAPSAEVGVHSGQPPTTEPTEVSSHVATSGSGSGTAAFEKVR